MNNTNTYYYKNNHSSNQNQYNKSLQQSTAKKSQGQLQQSLMDQIQSLNIPGNILLKNIEQEDYEKVIQFLLDRIYKLCDSIQLLSETVDQALSEQNFIREKYFQMKEKYILTSQKLQEVQSENKNQDQLQQNLTQVIEHAQYHREKLSQIMLTNNQQIDLPPKQCKFCPEKMQTENQLREEIKFLHQNIAILQGENSKLRVYEQIDKSSDLISYKQENSTEKIQQLSQQNVINEQPELNQQEQEIHQQDQQFLKQQLPNQKYANKRNDDDQLSQNLQKILQSSRTLERHTQPIKSKPGMLDYPQSQSGSQIMNVGSGYTPIQNINKVNNANVNNNNNQNIVITNQQQQQLQSQNNQQQQQQYLQNQQQQQHQQQLLQQDHQQHQQQQQEHLNTQQSVQPVTHSYDIQ